MPDIAELEAFARQMQAAMPDVPGFGPTLVALHDTLAAVLYASPESINVIGVAAEDMMGDAGAESVVAGDVPVIVEAYQVALETKAPLALVVRHAIPNGEVWWIRTHFQAATLPSDGRIVFVAVSRTTDEPPHGAYFQRLDKEAPRQRPGPDALTRPVRPAEGVRDLRPPPQRRGP